MKILIVAVFLTLAAPWSSVSAAPAHESISLTERQLALLAYAWSVGERYNLSLTTASILVQESSAGHAGPVGDVRNGFGRRSYGVMQVRLGAAQDALQHCPELGAFGTEEELIGRLIYDDHWNIEVAACYLDRLQRRNSLSWRELITAYNRGVRGGRDLDPNRHPYTRSVVAHATTGVVGRYREVIRSEAQQFYAISE